jgi:hypothetical protein
LAFYEFKRGDGFAGISNAGNAALGAQTMVEVLPALPEIGAAAGAVATLAPVLVFTAQVAAAKAVYAESLTSLTNGFQSQRFATRLPPAPYDSGPSVGDVTANLATLRAAVFNALPPREGPDAAQARYAQAKAFNDFVDRDFMTEGWGLYGGAGHRELTHYLQNEVPRWGPEWQEAVSRFFSRRSQYLDAPNEEWVAQQMQTILLRFLDQESQRSR